MENTNINKLLKFCLAQTEKGNDCFFHFSGHVKNVSISAHQGKWKQGQYPVITLECSLDKLDKAKVNYWIERVKNELN